MNTESGPQKDVLENIRKGISLSEEKRRQQRLEYNLIKLTEGDFQILKSDEFVRVLVDHLLGKSEEDRERNRILIIRLGEAAHSDDANVRERTLSILSLVGEHFLQSGEKDGILLVVNNFYTWLEHEKEVLPGFVTVIKRMEVLTLWLLEKSLWKEGEKVVALFHRIQGGNNDKATAFRSVVSQSLKNFATKATLEHLTDGYLLEDSNQQLFRNLLLFFETRASMYLLNRVTQSLNRNERLALIQLIPAFGSLVLPILEECLKNNPPWAVVRNVLCMLSDIGEDSCYTFIEQYFCHEDKRVQYEMICCIDKIGGSQLIHRLLQGLKIVNDDLKVFIIQILVENATRDETVLRALSELIENINSLKSRSRNRLASAAIAALKSFPCIKSVEILRNLKFEYGKLQGSEQMQLQIEEALKTLNPQIRHHQQRFQELPETISFDSDPQQTQKALHALASIEEKLRKLVQGGDMNGVGRLLNEQALSAARIKDFFLAEKLRDRLLEINPMALAEAVALGELIEEERATSHTGHPIGIWSELYEELTTEEFNALYSALVQEEYRKGDIIVRAGETDDVLYFLNSGYMSLNCLIGGNDNFLKRMGPGSILGGDQFFSASVWTVTLRALSDVHLHVLDHAVFVKISEDFSGVEENLRQYCSKYMGVPDLLKMSGDDRREYPRFPVPLFTQNVLFDPYGNKGKRSFKGELLDISKNGLAFIIKISSKNNAKLLLGRQIVSEIQIAEGGFLAECYGVIVGVRSYNLVEKDFTIHVKLSRKIEDGAFSRILALRR
ncbi:MAG: cyclic nucleotide-binding domain-containing protein [Proteobacteria bacterium]|nr:cyclic nucleotide-binding domain-containing protein [Pseudomonadota bacterium]